MAHMVVVVVGSGTHGARGQLQVWRAGALCPIQVMN